jgi:hypothetical protein
MKYRATFLVGAAVGYVLGSHAGRERYEQIKRLSRRIAQHPTVQETAGVLRAQAEDLAGTARSTISERLPERLRWDAEPRDVPAPQEEESRPARSAH